MGKWADKMMGSAPSSSPGGKSWSDRIIGQGRKPGKPATPWIQQMETVEGDTIPVHRVRYQVLTGYIGDRPVYGEKFKQPPEGEGAGASFGALLTSSITHDPEAKKRVFAESRGEDLSRYRTLSNGEVVRLGNDGVWYGESSGRPLGRLKSISAHVVKDIPRTAAEVGGFALAGPLGAGGAAVVSEIAERQVAKRALGERQTVVGDYVMRPLAQGALSVTTSGVGKLIGGGTVAATNKASRAVLKTGQTGRIIKNAEVIDKASIKARAAEFERFGLEADVARTTHSSTLAGVQRELGTKVGGAGRIIKAGEEKLRGQIVKAPVEGKGGLPPTALTPTEPGSELVNAAKGMKESLKSARREQSDRLYKQAFKEAGDANIDVGDTLKAIEKAIKEAPVDEHKEALRGVYDALMPPKKVAGSGGKIMTERPPTALKISMLHKLQRKIRTDAQGLISKDAAKKDKALADELFSIRNTLLNDIGKASPTYKVATQAYRYRSQAIEKFEGEFKKSLLNGLTKVEKDYVHKAPGKLFGSESSPELVRSVKSAVLSSTKDGARKWKAIQRGAMTDIVQDLDKNLVIPKWKMDILQAAVSPKQFEALQVFQKALKDIGYVPWAQRSVSASEGARVLEKEIGGLGYNLRRATLSPYIQSKEITASRIDKRAVDIAKELSTGAGIKNILRLKQLSPKSAEYIAIMTQIVGSEFFRQKYGGGRVVEQ